MPHAMTLRKWLTWPLSRAFGMFSGGDQSLIANPSPSYFHVRLATMLNAKALAEWDRTGRTTPITLYYTDGTGPLRLLEVEPIHESLSDRERLDRAYETVLKHLGETGELPYDKWIDHEFGDSPLGDAPEPSDSCS